MMTVKLASFLGENTDMYILAVFLILLVVGYVLFYIKAYKKSRAEDARVLEKLEDESEFEVEEIYVRVVSKCCGTRAFGTKTPHHEKGFFVSFVNDNGQTLEYRVDEETYLDVEEGMTGTVAVHNGMFYSFCADEDIE